nr:hypothetical protein B0A51_00166 [Rachicladosporium sp. CCFEE 5018]
MAIPNYSSYPPIPATYRGPLPPLTMRPPGPPPFPGYMLAPTAPMPPGFYQRYPVSAAYETGIQQGRREGYGAAVQDLREQEMLGAFRGRPEGDRYGGDRESEWGAQVEIAVGMERLQLEDGGADSTRSSRGGGSEDRSRRSEASASSKGSGRRKQYAHPDFDASRDPRPSASSKKAASTVHPGSSVSQRPERGSVYSSRRSCRSDSTSTPGHFSFPDLSARSNCSSKRDPILETFARAKRNASPPPSRTKSNRSPAGETHEHVWDEQR